MKFNEMTLEVLKEIGNIGTGNAATALSTMLDSKVDIGLPQCEMIPFSDMTDGFESPEEMVVGVLVQMTGDMEGFIMLVLTMDAAFELVELLMGSAIDCDREDYAAVMEALQPVEEIGNILINAYLSAIAGMAGMVVTPSLPAISIDMAMALMNLPAVVYGEVGETVLHMETDFHNDSSSVTGRYFLVPTMDSYGRLMNALGVSIE